MFPNYKKQGKQTERIIFYSPLKNDKMVHQRNDGLQKQKSISFNGYLGHESDQLGNKKHLHYENMNNFSQSLAQKYARCPELVQNLSNKQSRKQSLTNKRPLSKTLSNLNFIQESLSNINSDRLSQTSRVDWRKQKINCESLRSTIVYNYAGSCDLLLSPVPKNSCRKDNIFSRVELNRQKTQSKQANEFNNKQKYFIKRSFASTLKSSKVNQSLQKENQNKCYLIQKGKKDSSMGQKKNFFQFLANKTAKQKVEYVQDLRQTKQNSFTKFTYGNEKDLKVPRQNKVPSFLSSKMGNMNKQKNKDKIIVSLTPVTHQVNSGDSFSKNYFNKKTQNNKHARSLSTFQNIAVTNKKLLKTEKTPLFQAFKPKTMLPLGALFKGVSKNTHEENNKRHHKKSIDQRQMTYPQDYSIQAQKKIGENLQQKSRLYSSSLRQSLQRPQKYQNAQKKIDLRNLRQEQSFRRIKTQITLNKPQQQKQRLSPQIDDKQSKKWIYNELSTSKLPFEQVTSGETSQAIIDIKEALINCNLFSQEDYQDVFQSHKKDILKPNDSNKIQAVKQKKQFLTHKTSLRDLCDFPQVSDCNKQRTSFQEQKKMKQLAQMCEQKRSKWILDQTDTIKESLKQLSQFNTQKQLYQNQWQKISMKDFLSRNSNQTIFNNFESISQTKKRIHFQLKIDDVYQIDQCQSQHQIKQDTQEVSSKIRQTPNIDNILPSIKDFQMRWQSQEQIIFDPTNQCKQYTLITYWARHKETGLAYTIKKYQKQTFKQLGQVFLQNFMRKLKIQIQVIDHPNVQKIYGVLSDKMNVYVICEFTEIKLSQIIGQPKEQTILDSSEHYISMQNAVDTEKKKILLLKQVIDGLEQIHLNQINHKSLQPVNIGIVFNTCKISGFENSQLTQNLTNNFCSQYICPQVLFDSAKSAMDIWCLGILAYELFIGKRPFHQSGDQTVNNHTLRKILECNFYIPVQKAYLCQPILNMALKRNPKQRASIFQIKSKWNQKVKNYAKQTLIYDFMTNGLIESLLK